MHLLPRGCSFFSTWSINFEVHLLYCISRKKAFDAIFGRFWISLGDRAKEKETAPLFLRASRTSNLLRERERVSLSVSFKGLPITKAELMKSKQKPSPLSFPPNYLGPPSSAGCQGKKYPERGQRSKQGFFFWDPGVFGCCPWNEATNFSFKI